MNHCADGWITLEFVGPPGNADGIGAYAWVDDEMRELYATRSDGQPATRLHFGLGHSESVEVRVRWPDGIESWHQEVPVDRVVTVTHPDAD